MKSLSLSVLLLLLSLLITFIDSSLLTLKPLISPNVNFKNGRYLPVENGLIQFDWSGFTIEINSLQFPNNNFSMIVHLSDAGNWYNVNLYKMSTNQLIQQEILATQNNNGKIVNYQVNMKWLNSNRNDLYKIEIVKRTEALFGIVSFGGVTFVNQNSQPVNVLINNNKKVNNDQEFKIEFLGDSLSCAYGNLGKPPCDFTASTQDVTQSFVTKTAQYLNVTNFNIECWSGKGVVRNYGDKNTTSKNPYPSYYPRTLGNDVKNEWKFSQFVPDLVVITLGGNDFSTAPRPSYEEFSTGYNKLIDYVFDRYLPYKGNTLKMVLVCGPLSMDCYEGFSERVAMSRKEYGKTLFFLSMHGLLTESDDIGCAGHPSVKGDTKMANLLGKFIAGNVISRK
ncbi:hypothetical protein ABK040_006299 [Willaertia magna]